MSVIPPTSFILSKMKYYLKEKLPQDLYDQVLEKISPLYVFSLSASCRRLDGKNVIEDLDEKQIAEYLGLDTFVGETFTTDDSDKIMYSYKKLMDAMKQRYNEPVCIRVSVQARLEGIPDAPVQEPFVDEFFTGVEMVA
jgi:hypothetical protein